MKCLTRGCKKTALQNSNYCLDHKPVSGKGYRKAAKKKAARRKGSA